MNNYLEMMGVRIQAKLCTSKSDFRNYGKKRSQSARVFSLQGSFQKDGNEIDFFFHSDLLSNSNVLYRKPEIDLQLPVAIVFLSINLWNKIEVEYTLLRINFLLRTQLGTDIPGMRMTYSSIHKFKKSNDTDDQLVDKVLNLEMKYVFEFVIIAQCKVALI